MLSLQGEVVGEMSVGCSTASGKYLLPGLIARFRKEYSQVKINVVIGSRESVITRLLGGDVSLGVSSKVIEHYDLEYQDFFKDDVILIAPASHRWAKYRKIYPDDLLDEPLILREELGIAFVSRLAAARCIALGRIVEVSVEGMELSRNIYLARNRRQPLTRAQAKFWEYVNMSKSGLPATMSS